MNQEPYIPEPFDNDNQEAIRSSEECEKKCNRPNWGSEEFGDRIWVGVMRSSGEKLNEVIFVIDIEGLTDEAIQKKRAYVSTIVNCVNYAGQQSDLIRKLEGDVSAQRTELSTLRSELEQARKDGELLDKLERLVMAATRTGVSFDYCRHVEDGHVVEKGFRFMRYHELGERKDSIRAAIDQAKEGK